MHESLNEHNLCAAAHFACDHIAGQNREALLDACRRVATWCLPRVPPEDVRKLHVSAAYALLQASSENAFLSRGCDHVQRLLFVARWTCAHALENQSAHSHTGCCSSANLTPSHVQDNTRFLVTPTDKDVSEVDALLDLVDLSAIRADTLQDVLSDTPLLTFPRIMHICQKSCITGNAAGDTAVSAHADAGGTIRDVSNYQDRYACSNMGAANDMHSGCKTQVACADSSELCTRVGPQRASSLEVDVPSAAPQEDTVQILRNAQEIQEPFEKKATFGGMGDGREQFRQVCQVAACGSGPLTYFAVSDGTLCKVLVYTIADDCSVTSCAVIGSKGDQVGEFRYPCGVAWNARGELLVSDRRLHNIQVFDRTGTYIRTLTKSPGFPITRVLDPSAAATAAASVVSATATAADGSSTGGEAHLNIPCALAMSATGDVLVCNLGSHRVVVLNHDDGSLVRAFGGKGTQPAQFDGPSGVAVLDDGCIVVSDFGNARVQVLDAQGRFLRMFGTRGFGPGNFQKPFGIAVGRNGDIFVSDWGRNSVHVMSNEGLWRLSIGNSAYMGTPQPAAKHGGVSLDSPQGVCVDSLNHLYVACFGKACVTVLG
jgi:hypothetical protein